MLITVQPTRSRPYPAGDQQLFLVPDAWNDYGYVTMFDLVYRDGASNLIDIGKVKIARFGQDADADPRTAALLPETFETLSDEFFSLGQDDTYYANLGQLSANLQRETLQTLRDIALDQELLRRAIEEDVTNVSLLRSVSLELIERQYRYIAAGQDRRVSFGLEYEAHAGRDSSPLTINFEVTPASTPPTNIHVLIGSNGVGKTRLLQRLSNAVLHGTQKQLTSVTPFGGRNGERHGPFANLVSVAFSAFDPFPPIAAPDDAGIDYTYVGLKQPHDDSSTEWSPKSPDDLATEFGEAVDRCLTPGRQDRWLRAIRTLESDQIICNAQVIDLVRVADEDSSQDRIVLRAAAADLFSTRLSAGHKIVLLTVTRLVEAVSEGSLVLLDEPESHLHPPLLAAFVRALSDLLVDRNGLAIIATHSPVVLQEVPRSCVQKLRRTGSLMTAEPPRIETFGENVGVLTHEVFGLEVTASGFHRELTAAVDECNTYEEVIERFGDQLGGEAKGIVRILLASKAWEGQD